MNSKRPDTQDGKVTFLPGYDKAFAQQHRPASHRAVAGGEQAVMTSLLKALGQAGELALVVLRISEYPELTESFGDACGQELMRKVGQRLANCLRSWDLVQQLGDGEFAIVLPQPESLDVIDVVCERLLDSCNGRYELEPVSPMVSSAVGVSLYPADTDDVGELLRFAQIALRRARCGERMACQYFSREMLTYQRQRIWMEGEFERALADERFILQYQPQYDVNSKAIVGMEALVRLVGDDGKLIPPDMFIGLAEEKGFIVPLGYWVIRQACAQLAAWRYDGCGPRSIAVNVSPRQLSDRGLPMVISRAVRESGLEYSDLVLEITESSLLDWRSTAGHVLQQLRSLGVRFAIDDFGTGYASFAMLTEVPLDTFKMDRSLMARVDSDPRARQVASAMITLALELGYEVIAEGVETPEQCRFLEQSGCHLAQGFGLARPQSAGDVGSLLQTAAGEVMVN